MTNKKKQKTKETLKGTLKNEVSPLLIGLRNEIKSTNEKLDKIAQKEVPVNELEIVFDGQKLKALKGKDGTTPVPDKDYLSKESALKLIDENTPRKGVQYFTSEEIKEFLKKVTPVKGVDYKDGEDGKSVDREEIIKEVLGKATPIKGVHYRDGIDGVTKTIVEYVDLSGEDIRNKLEELKGTARLSAKAIKGLDEYIKTYISVVQAPSGIGGSGGGGISQVYHDTTLTGSGTQLDILKVNPDLTLDSLQFNISATPLTNAAGLLQWNATDETLDLGMPNDVTLQLGQENQLKVRNNTGSTLLNGKPVYTTGMLGNRPTIAYAKGDAETTGDILGILTQDIANNADGKVTTSGYVRNINTTGTPYGETWNDGDILWVSKATAGALTNVEPSAPHHSSIVGQVVNAHVTQGSILVRIVVHRRMQELSDVDGTPLTTTGQIMVWDQTNGYFDPNYNITNYVPYIGATTDVDLGSYELKANSLNINNLGFIHSDGNINVSSKITFDAGIPTVFQTGSFSAFFTLNSPDTIGGQDLGQEGVYLYFDSRGSYGFFSLYHQFSNINIKEDVTFTETLIEDATSGTLSTNWTRASGTYYATFDNGDSRYVDLTLNSDSISWTGGLSSEATSARVGLYAGAQTQPFSISDLDTMNVGGAPIYPQNNATAQLFVGNVGGYNMLDVPTIQTKNFDGQTANSQEWLNFVGTTLAKIDASGKGFFDTINVGTLPTSSSGLSAGDVWVDTAGGLNILKVV